MDGRPHILSVIPYQELCRVVEGAEARKSPTAFGAGLRETGREEREDGDPAVAFRSLEFSGFTFGGHAESVPSAAAVKYDGGKNERKNKQEMCAFDNVGGFELGFRCGEAELARAQSASVGVNFHEDIRTKSPLDPFGRLQGGGRGGGETAIHQEKASCLCSEPRETVEQRTGIRERRSIPSTEHVSGANPGKGRYWRNGSKTLEGGDYNVARTKSPDVLKAPAAEEGGAELAGKIAVCLGPTGPGLLAVRGVPGVAALRKRLLPLAKRLALMPDHLRRPVLKKHDLNTDVPLKRPDRPVSAFATQLRYGRHIPSEIESCNALPASKAAHRLGNVERNSEGRRSDITNSDGDKDIDELGRTLRQLGSCMVEVGLLVARFCDEAFPGAELEDAIWDSGTAKGRLIHYHSQVESRFMSSKPTHRSSKGVQGGRRNNVKRSDSETHVSRLPVDTEGGNQKCEAWQQWHYDYGLFTVLTSPMFMIQEPSEAGKDLLMNKVETSSWNHTGDEHCGLTIMHQGVPQYVNIPPDCLVVQVGEAAQILSGGKLAATAHCVCRPPQADVSRETFVVFLQPAWHRTLTPPAGFDRETVLHSRDEGSVSGNTDLRTRSNLPPNYSRDRLLMQHCEDKEHHKHEEVRAPFDSEEVFIRPGEEEDHRSKSKQQTGLLLSVPPLASRWNDGCTFADFSKATTRQYYGADGRQSQK